MENKQRKGKTHEVENVRLKKRIIQLESKLATYELLKSLPTNSDNIYVELLDNIPLAIVNLDSEGNIQFANASFMKLFDVDNAFLIKKFHINNFKPFKGSIFLKKINALINSQMQFDHEIKVGEIGNENSTFRSRGITITSHSNEVSSYMIIIGDITKRKMAEENLIMAKEAAEESNMLKTAFLSNLSHEIRTPLNHILGFLELLLVDNTTVDERIEYSSFIRNSSEDLLKRIEDILDISKIETGQMDTNKEKINIIDFLEDLYQNCIIYKTKHKRENIDFVLNKTHNYSNVLLHTDPEKLRQIITSFVENAFIFTKEGTIEIGFNIGNNNGINFYVKDTGVGIEKTHHESIFEHFRQVDNSQTRKIGGSGLGLAISRGLAKLLSGTITVESEPGKGSVFFLNLPDSIISLETKTETSVLSTTDTTYDWHESTILIAEYEEVDYNLLKVILGKTGAKLLRAKTGDEAISIYHKNKPDLIIINYNLPVINAEEFARIIKTKDSMVPIIARINYAGQNEIQSAKSSGIDKLITKPIQNNNLLNIINDLIINGWF